MRVGARVYWWCALMVTTFACDDRSLNSNSQKGDDDALMGADEGTLPSPKAAAVASPEVVDDRPVERAEVTPPPIAGGTLLVTSDGSLAIAADQERDIVSAVDLETRTVLWTANLDARDRPGRVVESADGNLHVALRGSGAVATFDRDGALLQRTPVCADPTGLAFSNARSALLVACRDGSLATIALEDYAVESGRLEPDLRDVVIVEDDSMDPPTETVYVTRLRSAELLLLDVTLSVTDRQVPASARNFDPRLVDTPTDQVPPAAVENIDMDPSVGWRAAPTNDGFVFVHQRGRRQSVALDETHVNAYGSTEGSANCSVIAGPAVTFVTTNGVVTSSRQLSGRLFVDVAESSDGLVAFAEAGSPHPDAPASFAAPPTVGGDFVVVASGVKVARSGENVPVVSLSRRSRLDVPNSEMSSPCEANGAVVTTPEYNQAVAVAFNPLRPFQLVALLREPAQLLIAELDTGKQVQVTLSELSMRDTGHDLFHQSTSSGLTCAGCHPEGGEDGRVWLFNDVEHRRTQSLEVGLRDTQPFHWRGELDGVDSLMQEVFSSRMGGALQSEGRVSALADFIYQLESPTPMRDDTDALALEGKALFESAEVGCATCHAGPKLTDNQSYDVGTGEVLQVPSLVGVAHRTPLMHDGCATDLWDRFEPGCGGDRHGSTAQLTFDEMNALVAYMESL